MAFENSAGINVSNFYGPRGSAGSEGVTKTEGIRNEFIKDLSDSGLSFGFPVPGVDKPVHYVTGVDTSQAVGTVTATTIGGVNIATATEAAPVAIQNGNTGVVAITGATGGMVVIKFNKYPQV